MAAAKEPVAGETVAACRFLRDRATWLAYLLLAAASLISAALGPAMPFLKAEMHLSYKIAALHFSAWACGSLLAGLTGDKIFRRFGRVDAPLCCILVCIPAIAGLTCIRHPAASIGCIVVLGFACSIALQGLVSLLSDRFGSQRAVMIGELNAIGSFACGVAPLVVSMCERLNLGWRAGYWLPVILLLVCLGILRTKPAALHQHSSAGSCSGSLPGVYWGYWSLLATGVACEWSMIFWSADFMENIGKLHRHDAAACVSIFLVAMVLGRWLGSRFSARINIDVLLPITCLLALCGFFLFWLGHSAAAMLTGLFITGLGIANIYPLSYAACLESMPGRTALAAARASVGSGGAILTAPLVLGYVADRASIFTGYGIVAVFLVACAGLAFAARRLAKRGSAQAEIAGST